MPIFFFIFAFLVILGSIGVISGRNPVYSVLWLIFTFINTAGLFILIGAEFIGMILIIVYVGAVAVLFLFIVMMLEVNIAKIKQALLGNRIISFALVGLLLGDLIILIKASLKDQHLVAPVKDYVTNMTNTHAIGEVLYTKYFIIFQMSGLVLLLAMVGCIALTLRQREGVKKQNVTEQLLRTRSSSVEVTQVEKGVGIDGIDYR